VVQTQAEIVSVSVLAVSFPPVLYAIIIPAMRAAVSAYLTLFLYSHITS
jgi:hypothetical protein